MPPSASPQTRSAASSVQPPAKTDTAANNRRVGCGEEVVAPVERRPLGPMSSRRVALATLEDRQRALDSRAWIISGLRCRIWSTTSPPRSAMDTISALLPAPSLPLMLATWTEAVFLLMTRASAISPSVRPSATNASTSCSRGVRSCRPRWGALPPASSGSSWSAYAIASSTDIALPSRSPRATSSAGRSVAAWRSASVMRNKSCGVTTVPPSASDP